MHTKNGNNTQTAEITMSKIPQTMSFKSCNPCNIVFEHLRLSFNVVDTVFMCKIGIKYRNVSQAVCAYAHDFRKRPGCALIEAYALIRTNMVYNFSFSQTRV